MDCIAGIGSVILLIPSFGWYFSFENGAECREIRAFVRVLEFGHCWEYCDNLAVAVRGVFSICLRRIRLSLFLPFWLQF